MRTAREQMLCVISQNWTAGLAPLEAIGPALDQLFTDAGVVHYACLALLPPGPGDNGQPSLMLELTVDEGVRPCDLLAVLAHHPGGALWPLYERFLPPPPASTGTRNEALRKRLLADLSIADGGFIGPRDRTLAQVRQERELYTLVRETVTKLPPDSRNERMPFAAAMARSVRANSKFDWALQPAPRSFWRARGGRGKTLFLASAVGAVLLLALLMMWGLRGLDSLAAANAPILSPWVGNALNRMLEMSWRLAILAGGFIGALVLYWLVSYLIRPKAGPWHQWSDQVARELNRPTDALSATATHVFAWLTVIVVLACLLAAGVFLVWGLPAVTHPWLWHQRPLWLEIAVRCYALVFFSLLLVLAIGLRPAFMSVPRPGDGLLTLLIKAFRRWLHRPQEQEFPRAQQVHPAIERCEADLVGRTAHMISLTDLRTPYAWSAFWTRLSLRLVTAVGHAFFTEGRLGDAPGIQFSHWHIVDKGRRLLFCANFDGTFGGYLDDFIKGPSVGTTLFWRWSELWNRPGAAPGHPDVSHPLSFAPTRLVVFRGVKCELKFKAYARASMLPHVYRFDALDFSIDQKNRATRLRDALCGDRNDANDDCIMRTIES